MKMGNKSPLAETCHLPRGRLESAGPLDAGLQRYTSAFLCYRMFLCLMRSLCVLESEVDCRELATVESRL